MMEMCGYTESGLSTSRSYSQSAPHIMRVYQMVAETQLLARCVHYAKKAIIALATVRLNAALALAVHMQSQ